MATSYLLTYQPLALTGAGRAAAAVQELGLAPFLDGSCRREPSFSARWPLVTSLCRPGFSERLEKDDQLVYLTCRGDYHRYQAADPRIPVEPHWRLVAILRVLQTFPSHKKAAEYLRAQGVEIPNNLIVPGSVPVPLNQTHARISRAGASGKHCATGARAPKRRGCAPKDIQQWDAVYQERAATNRRVALCEPMFCELSMPPVVTREDRAHIEGGKLLSTLSPHSLTSDQFARYFALANAPARR